MCRCETNLGSAGGAIAGGVLVHFSSRSDVGVVCNCALLTDQHHNFTKWALFGHTLQDSDHGGHPTYMWT